MYDISYLEQQAQLSRTARLQEAQRHRLIKQLHNQSRTAGRSVTLPRRFVTIMIQLVTLFVLAANAASAHGLTGQVIELEFINHLQGGMIEQDIYVESETDRNQVVRIASQEELTEETLAKMAYSTAEMQEHNLFGLGERPLGPFAKGQALGFTMEEWFAASGSGTYTITGEQAHLDIAFENLVP
ncbi:MAG: hypothetical protein M3220_15465, partial [Chloroflexota bacterium]|nr:hypothetical protein [Chloroflexota bacterium]